MRTGNGFPSSLKSKTNGAMRIKLTQFRPTTWVANQLEGKKMELDFVQYVRKPFVVEAVEVTVDNIAEIAKVVGDLETKDDGTPYIKVDRRLVPNVFRVYPGFFMTRMGDHIRCYNRTLFFNQFVESDAQIMDWVNFLNPSEEKDAQKV